MRYLPLFHDLQQKKCLIIGGGHVAQRKAELLIKAGAKITLVAPDILDELLKLIQANQGECHARSYQSQDLEQAELVIVATNDENLNQEVAKKAQQKRLLINVVDNPELSNIIFPAIIDRSPVVVAVSSAGTAPVLTRVLRGKLESFIPAAYGQLAQLIGEYRQAIKTRLLGMQQRKNFWESVLEGPVSELVFSGQIEKAKAELEQKLDHIEKNIKVTPVGEVYLVGAGPGDPDLLTFKALRLMQRAEVVLYDRLIPKEILDYVRRDAEKIYVGKKAEQHTVSQEEINQLLIHYAQQGKRVCRLKGGDPFIFGRGGEEIAGLVEAGIPFQVVPGITAASGCACYAGIPLTHRDYAQSVQFLTGHLKADSEEYDWPALVRERQTLVFYMGFNKLAHLFEQLLKHGMVPTMPVALIQQGTLPQQKVFTGELATFCQQLSQQEIIAPTLIIVGEVVKLHGQLAWRENQ